MWLKLAKNDQKLNFLIFLNKSHIRFKNGSIVFHDLKNVKKAEKSLKICQFWPILTNFSYIL
jgi:hypothetical protein